MAKIKMKNSVTVPSITTDSSTRRALSFWLMPSPFSSKAATPQGSALQLLAVVA